MGYTTISSRPSRTDLLDVARRLPLRQFFRFCEDIRELRGFRLRAKPAEIERALLARIKRPFPAAKARELRRLLPKLEAETLTVEESRRLKALAFAQEGWNAERLQAVADLAALREEPFDKLAAQYGYEPHKDA